MSRRRTLAKYKTDVQPFLEPFDAFAATSTVGATWTP